MSDKQPRFVCKRDGRIVPFSPERILEALVAAFARIDGSSSQLTLDISSTIVEDLAGSFSKTVPTTAQIFEKVCAQLVELKRPEVAAAFAAGMTEKAERNAALRVYAIPSYPTFNLPLCDDVNPSLYQWDKGRFAVSVSELFDVQMKIALAVAHEVGNSILSLKKMRITNALLFELARSILSSRSYSTARVSKQQGENFEKCTVKSSTAAITDILYDCDPESPRFASITINAGALLASAESTFGKVTSQDLPLALITSALSLVRSVTRNLVITNIQGALEPCIKEHGAIFTAQRLAAAASLTPTKSNSRRISLELKTDSFSAAFLSYLVRVAPQSCVLPRIVLDTKAEAIAYQVCADSLPYLSLPVQFEKNYATAPHICTSRAVISLPHIFMSEPAEQKKLIADIPPSCIDGLVEHSARITGAKAGRKLIECGFLGSSPSSVCASVSLVGLDELVAYKKNGRAAEDESRAGFAYEAIRQIVAAILDAARQSELDIEVSLIAAKRASSTIATFDRERRPLISAVLPVAGYSNPLRIQLSRFPSISPSIARLCSLTSDSVVLTYQTCSRREVEDALSAFTANDDIRSIRFERELAQ